MDHKTYAISSPIQTHTRPATCAEVDCQHYLSGWVTHVDVSTELGQRQAKYIANDSGRRFQETTGLGDIGAGRREFMFPPGQKCFQEHRVSLEREPLFVVRDLGQRRVHARGEDWVDDFRSHMDKINQQLGR